jgi:hypothetical protein
MLLAPFSQRRLARGPIRNEGERRRRFCGRDGQSDLMNFNWRAAERRNKSRSETGQPRLAKRAGARARRIKPSLDLHQIASAGRTATLRRLIIIKPRAMLIPAKAVEYSALAWRLKDRFSHAFP